MGSQDDLLYSFSDSSSSNSDEFTVNGQLSSARKPSKKRKAQIKQFKEKESKSSKQMKSLDIGNGIQSNSCVSSSSTENKEKEEEEDEQKKGLFLVCGRSSSSPQSQTQMKHEKVFNRSSPDTTVPENSAIDNKKISFTMSGNGKKLKKKINGPSDSDSHKGSPSHCQKFDLNEGEEEKEEEEEKEKEDDEEEKEREGNKRLKRLLTIEIDKKPFNTYFQSNKKKEVTFSQSDSSSMGKSSKNSDSSSSSSSSSSGSSSSSDEKGTPTVKSRIRRVPASRRKSWNSSRSISSRSRRSYHRYGPKCRSSRSSSSESERDHRRSSEERRSRRGNRDRTISPPRRSFGRPVSAERRKPLLGDRPMAMTTNNYRMGVSSQLMQNPFVACANCCHCSSHSSVIYSRQMGNSAVFSRATPPSHPSWDLDCKVYIGNLREDVTRQEIRHIFAKYGPLSNLWLAKNPPGFAFVGFEYPRDAKMAVKNLNGTIVRGAAIKVQMSTGMSRYQEQQQQQQQQQQQHQALALNMPHHPSFAVSRSSCHHQSSHKRQSSPKSSHRHHYHEHRSRHRDRDSRRDGR